MKESDFFHMDTIPQKQCSKCKQWLPATREIYSIQKGAKDGLFGTCKECAAAYYKSYSIKLRAYNETHLDERHARRQTYLQEHATEIEAYWQAHREAQIAKQKANYRIYQQTHPEQRKANNQNHRARKRNALGTYTAQDIQAQYKNQKGKCYYCHKKVGKTYDVDHVIPLSKGGSNCPENLVIACPHCNRSKSNKIIRLL